ncbi:MAG: DUF362 domain-containing protein [Spirochaetia bacterium]|jgi:uncharacterized protein (DUF362 family)|nr:DUF362 domain-containing protein [Spirochaetia bacterium]
MKKDNKIYVIYGNDPALMIKKILTEAKIEKQIKPGSLIGIKPNLVVPKPSSSGATTSPVIAGAVIQYLKEKGFDNIIILEGSWVGDSTKKAFKTCGFEELSKKYNVPLFDTKDDSFTVKTSGGMKMEICDRLFDVDFLINMPVIKGHCQTLVTGALKNMKGCITDKEKRHFHSLGLHDPIAHLNKIRCADFVVADGLCGDLDFEEGGNPVQMNRIVCGTDSVLTDAYISSLMGYRPEDVEYIVTAAEIGVGSLNLDEADIIELNKDRTIASAVSTGKVSKLAKHTIQKNACSACYANLIHALARLDEEGKLSHLKEKISIGQGFRWEKSDGTGIGSCTSSFEKYLPGCPPAPLDIIDFLKDEIG